MGKFDKTMGAMDDEMLNEVNGGHDLNPDQLDDREYLELQYVSAGNKYIDYIDANATDRNSAKDCLDTFNKAKNELIAHGWGLPTLKKDYVF